MTYTPKTDGWTRFLTQRVRCVVGILVILGLASTAVRAQTLWSRPYQTNQVAVEWMAPTFQDGNIRPLTSAAFLSVSYAVTRQVTVAGELPASVYAATDSDSTITKTALGNPYLGLAIGPSTLPLLLEVGVRVPIGSDNRAASTGAVADVGRGGPAFLPDLWSGSVYASGRVPLTTRMSLQLRGGAVVAQRPAASRDAWGTRLRYSAQLWREGQVFVVGVTATGRADMSASGSFGAISTHQAAASVLLDLHPIQPGLLVGTWLDDNRGAQASVFFGLTLSTSLP